MKLINPTDEALNSAFAEHVAGWRYHPDAPLDMKQRAVMCWIPPGMETWQTSKLPSFSRSADAVLPLLEKMAMWDAIMNSGYRVRLSKDAYTFYWEAESDTFPRAACIALLRANGVEVKFTPQTK